MTEKIRCIIVDDELPARRVIEKFLEDVPGFEIAAQCRNAFEAMEALETHKPQLLFLDINMPKLSGLSFLKTLRHPPLVIITTAYREYALEGFELDVLDYLHKPFSPERFFKALDKVRQRLSTPKQTTAGAAEKNIPPGMIFIREDKRSYQVETADILYVESVGDYVKFHTVKKTFMTRQTLKKSEDILSSEPHFIRVHKSYIVNMKKVGAHEGNLLFIGQKTVPVGQQYRSSVQNYIDSLSV